MARALAVQLQFAEDLARRLLARQLREVRRAEADAAEDVPEGLGAAERVLLAGGLAVCPVAPRWGACAG